LITANGYADASQLAASTAKDAAQPLSPTQVKEVQQVINDYLLNNPKLIGQVIQKLQLQQRQEMQSKTIQAIHANKGELFDSITSPSVGNPNSAVTIVEFSDYQCPNCKEMSKTLKNVIEQDKNLKVVFKEFPIFPGSAYAAQAALAANMQGKYLELRNALMADKNPLTKDDVLETAKRVGLSLNKLEKDMQSQAVKDELKQNLDLAQKLDLPGTPALIIQSNTDKDKTYFIPGQVSLQMLQNLIKKAS